MEIRVPEYLKIVTRTLFFGKDSVNDIATVIAKKYNMRQSDVVFLFVLAINEGIKTASDIARVSDLKKGNISVIVESLCLKGYLEQRNIKEDRRQKYLYLTEKAKEVVNEFLQMFENNIVEVIKDIPKDKLDICYEVLNMMFNKMTKIKNNFCCIENAKPLGYVTNFATSLGQSAV